VFLGKVNLEAFNEIVAHIARVNEITVAEADQLVSKVLSRDDPDDSIEWTPVISKKLQKKFPALQLIEL